MSMTPLSAGAEDNKLVVLSEGKHYRYTVRYDRGFDDEITVEIEQIYSIFPGELTDNTVNLPPSEALKLFTWLQQEQEELERLAKEEQP